MQSWEVEFTDFCKSMWFENIVERSDWREEPIDFDQYMSLNNEWLKKQHAKYKMARMRNLDAWIQ